MKFNILPVLCACILLVSCDSILKKHENMADRDSATVTLEAVESLPVHDYDRAADHLGARCTQNEVALFFFCSLSTIDEPGLIYYVDKASGASGTLCGRPECMHDSSACNAYIGPCGYGICFYDGKLIFAAEEYAKNGAYQGVRIYRLNLDGTGREKIGELISPDESNAFINTSYMVHRGHLFFGGTKGEIRDGAYEYINFVYDYDLGSKKRSVIYEVPNEGIMRMQPVGDDLYIFDQAPAKNSVSDNTWEWTASVYHLGNREMDVLFHGESPGMMSEYWVEDQVVYMSAVSEGAVYAFDMESKKFSRAASADGGIDVPNFLANGLAIRNTYSDSSFRTRKIQAVDFTGKTILDQEFEDPFQDEQGSPYGYTMFDADDENLYFYFTDISDENGTLAMLAAFPLDGSDYRILWRKE